MQPLSARRRSYGSSRQTSLRCWTKDRKPRQNVGTKTGTASPTLRQENRSEPSSRSWLLLVHVLFCFCFSLVFHPSLLLFSCNFSGDFSSLLMCFHVLSYCIVMAYARITHPPLSLHASQPTHIIQCTHPWLLALCQSRCTCGTLNRETGNAQCGRLV